MQEKVCKKNGDVYYIMNRQELLGFFLRKRRNYKLKFLMSNFFILL